MPSPTALPSIRAASRLDSLRAKPILDFFPMLCVLRAEIAELRFATYRRRPDLSERLRAQLGLEDDGVRKAADRLSEKGVEFWNAVMSLAMKRGTLRESFVDVALLHNFNLPETSFVLSRDQVLSNGIREIIPQLAPGDGLLMCSRLRLVSGETAYLPMLDFTCLCHGENALAIRKMVKLAGAAEGVLVRSGRSYHFYGTLLFSQAQWIRFLALSLLFAPVADSRYIAHRLLDGECRLKIVDSSGGMIPVIEEAFEDV